MTLPLAAAIVCKNNEGTIVRTLESVAPLCREIVAVDSGSTDGTIGLLEKFGARVIRSAWLGHVKTKQMALEACTQEWAFCIDSDESILPDLGESIKGALASVRPEIGGFMINRKVFYRGVPLNYAWQPEWRCRLVRRGAAAWGGIDPHDVLSVKQGETGRLRGTLRHDSFETFMEQLGKQVRYAEIQAQGMLAEGHKGSPINLLVSPGAAFLKQLILKRAFLDGRPGWMAAACTAAQALMKHVALLEKGEQKQV